MIELNQQQKEIVYTESPKVIVASGAGAGKSFCIIERIKFLLSQGYEGKNIYAITYTNAAAEELIKRLPDNSPIFAGTIHSLANRILLQNNIDTSWMIQSENFDELFYTLQEHYNEIKIPQVDYILIDEFQDVCDNEYDFIFNTLKPKEFMAVGDSCQCQPAGTKVQLRNHIVKNIEDIQIGDSIVWYDSKQSFISGPTTKSWNSIEKKVLDIQSRDFCNDNLITITTETGKQSSYTPNHRTFIKLNKDSEYNHAVYLMCDENYRFRIGKIPFRNENNTSSSNPWRKKMLDEGCCKMWILKLFKTDKEARVLETKLSYKYQIPQTCWQINKVQWTKEDIDYIYEGLNTKYSAEKCLKEFNRDINYPLLDIFNSNIQNQHYAYNAVAEIYAANLMPEVMSCLVYDIELKDRKKYEQIISVDFDYIEKPIKVYSLKVEGETYVADQIVTHNSIYGFKGSNYHYFMNMVNDPDIQLYNLNLNYRCGSSIIDFAENFLYPINDIYMVHNESQTGLKGRVQTFEFSLFILLNEVQDYSYNYKDIFILTRTNKEISEIQFVLNKYNIPNDTFKKSDLDKGELGLLLEKDSVKILTVHSAKGLEAKKVIVLGMKPYNNEERRVCYVAATRAKEELIWLTNKKQKKQKMISWG